MQLNNFRKNIFPIVLIILYKKPEVLIRRRNEHLPILVEIRIDIRISVFFQTILSIRRESIYQNSRKMGY